MVKRQRQNRQTPADYIPWGKPQDVVIENIEAEKLDDGRIVQARYVERFKGESSDSRTAHDTHNATKAEVKAGLEHPNGCQGQPGIAITWIRDGRTWCRYDYRLRFGEDPDGATAHRPAPYRRTRRTPEEPRVSKVASDRDGNAILKL